MCEFRVPLCMEIACMHCALILNIKWSENIPFCIDFITTDYRVLTKNSCAYFPNEIVFSTQLTEWLVCASTLFCFCRATCAKHTIRRFTYVNLLKLLLLSFLFASTFVVCEHTNFETHKSSTCLRSYLRLDALH